MHKFETTGFRGAFEELLAWRRDVRSFRPDPLPEPLVQALIQAAALAPSVGLSQPWRFIRLVSDHARAAVRSNFERCNVQALAGYDGEDAGLYARLKLSGLGAAPLQLAVFCDRTTAQGRGLGRQTMPETLDYSVVTAIHTIWLAARTRGVGLGWVSIIDAAALTTALDAPPDWRLIAMLCLGWPVEESLTPELERRAWERRRGHPIDVLER